MLSLERRREIGRNCMRRKMLDPEYRAKVNERAKIRRKEKHEILSLQRAARYRTPKGKYKQIRACANKRKIGFYLTLNEYIEMIWGKPCCYCGETHTPTGIDRKDPNKPYRVGNIVPTCCMCNKMKWTFGYDEFIERIEKIYLHAERLNDPAKVQWGPM